MAQHLEDLLRLGVAAEDRRNSILSRQLVEVRREVLQERRQLEPLLQALFLLLVIPHPGGQARDDHLGLDPLAPDDRHRHPLCFFEDRREQIARFDHVSPGPARVQLGQPEEQLRGGRQPQVLDRLRRKQPQMVLQRPQEIMGVEAVVAHHLTEQIPLDLREPEADVLVGQDAVAVPTRFIDGTIDDTLGAVTQTIPRDIEVFHAAPPLPRASSANVAPAETVCQSSVAALRRSAN